jgi:excisionase family DNA binding protein
MRRDFGRLMSLREVAEHLNLSLSTVRRWTAQRRFQTVKLGGRVLVPECMLYDFIARSLRPEAEEEQA